MRFAVVGAGGIGSLIGGRLARAGADVVLIARGPHLAAMQAGGLEVRSQDGSFTIPVACTGDLASIEGADAVFVTTKAHSLPPIARQLAGHLGEGAALVTAQNGLPWWYFQRLGGELEGLHLESVDPGGILRSALDAERVIGCVVYPATRVVEPGVVEHLEGNRLSLGELDGARSERSAAIAAALTQAGFRAPVQPDLRTEIWVKLLGNAVLNPISALTRATLAAIVSDPLTHELALRAMEEVAAVAEATGIRLPISVERRLKAAGEVGGHRTSMLQDLESGRPLEIEAVVGAVVELGSRLGVAVPRLESLHATLALLAGTINQPAAGGDRQEPEPG